MDVNQVIILILVLVLIAVGLYYLIRFFQGRSAGTDLEEEEFSKDLRKMQLIDIREPDDFKAGHILGARNIPSTQFKVRLAELRKDKPVYLYGSGAFVMNRISLLLKNEGFDDIYRLKGGYDSWSGKIKRGN